MGEHNYASFQKCCATCDYWTGMRTIHGSGPCSYASVEINQWAKCYSPTWRGSTSRDPSGVCSEYSKWGPLK